MENIPRTALGFLAVVSFILFLLTAFSIVTAWNTLAHLWLSNFNTTIGFLGGVFQVIFFLVCSIVCYNVFTNTEDETGHFVDEKKAIQKETIKSISSDLEDAKYEVMVKTLVNRSRNKGLLNPELSVEGAIREKMASGKTKEQAIEELYSQE